MSYHQLGYDVEIDTPLGTQKVSFDLEKLAQDFAAQAVDAGWPRFEAKVSEALPKFVRQATDEVRPELEEFRNTTLVQLGLGASVLAALVVGAIVVTGGDTT